MKRFLILFAIPVLIMIQFNCSHDGGSLGEVHLMIYEETDFGDVMINEVRGYSVSIEGDQAPGALYYYDRASIKITVSDKINFTLDTSMTDSYVDENDETSFSIRFNPKSSGDFTALVKIKTETKTYKHYLYGRGI